MVESIPNVSIEFLSAICADWRSSKIFIKFDWDKVNLASCHRNLINEQMKTIITVLATFLALSVFGQDDTLPNKNDSQKSGSKTDKKDELIIRDASDTNKVLVRDFYDSGQIRSEINYFPYKERKMHGKKMEWFENGQIKADVNFENGLLHGAVLTYWENGAPKRNDLFEKDVLIEGVVLDINGNEMDYFDYMIMPNFPGGESGLFEYLGKSLKYPKKPKRKGIQGRIILSFVVEKDGSITNVKITQSLNKELEAEALRVVMNMPNWEVGLVDGEKKRFTFNLPIKFTLRDI